MSKIKHQCPKSDTSVQNRTLLYKIRHWCPKSDTIVQNQTLLPKMGPSYPSTDLVSKIRTSVQSRTVLYKLRSQCLKIRHNGPKLELVSEIRHSVQNQTLESKIGHYRAKSETTVQNQTQLCKSVLVSKIRTRVQNQTLASKIRHCCRSSLGCVSRCSILQQGRSPIRSSQLSFTSSSKEDRRLGKGLTIFLVYCSCNNQMLTFSLLEQSEGLLCCSLSFHPIRGLCSIVREINFFFHSALASLYYLL